MKTEQLEKTFSEKLFKKEYIDTGIEYTKEINHIRLICYIEPNINVAITIVYKWNNNDVKGGYTISFPELQRVDSIASLFRATLSEIPEYVGEKDIHIEIRETINKIFN